MIKCCLLAAYLLTLWPNAHELNDYRKCLTRAVNNSKTTDSLYNSLNSIKDKSPVLISYMGALEALKAKHSWNPFNKMKYLDNAEDTFAHAVAAQPNNMEIRFMRFSVEHNVPGFLGVNKNLYADKSTIIKQLQQKYYASANKETVVTIIKFLLTSKRCTPAENVYLTETLSALN